MIRKLFTAAVLAALSFAGYAGTDVLTNAQLNNLRTGVCANATAKPMMQSGNVTQLETWLNQAANPTVLAWGVYVPKQVFDEAPSYTTYDSLTQGKRDSWVRFLDADTRDYTKNTNRAWIVDVWGNATGGSNSEKILLAATSSATNAQNTLGGTVRATGTVSALDRVYQGIVATIEVSRLIFKDDGTIYTCP